MGSSLSWRELSDLPRSEICDAFEMAGWRGRKKAERLFNVGLESFQRHVEDTKTTGDLGPRGNHYQDYQFGFDPSLIKLPLKDA